MVTSSQPQPPLTNPPLNRADTISSSTERRRLGELLVEEGFVTPEVVDKAAVEARKTGQYFGAVLVRQGKLTREQLGKALAKQNNVAYVSLSKLEVDRSLLTLLPQEFMQNNKVLPIAKEGGKLVMAMVEPNNRRIQDEITFMTGMRPHAVVTTAIEFAEAFGRLFQTTKDYTGLFQEIHTTYDHTTQEDVRQQQQAEMQDVSNPLAKLVNSILEEAIERGASDIHVEARSNNTIIRFRIDGILHQVLELPSNMESSFSTRVKVMSRMDIAEHRRPQDGRITFPHKGTEYNLRVNTLPVGEGKEKIVIRILRPAKNITDFGDMGFTPAEVTRVENLYTSPYGIVLVCGPTGSGKTTTLYTILHKLNDTQRNISTIEDPIELRIEGLNQSQVNHKAEFTFASALRALLRQDPDVIMVGEIRDYETLESAIHASLTGHLVFSTIHANTTAATVTRLVEMGAEPALISSTLLGVIAQRLVRTICPNCKTAYEATLQEKALIFAKRPDLQNKTLTLYKGSGCGFCNNSGYSGRSGLYEILVLDRKIRHLVSERRLDLEIEDAAVASGMKTLHMSGLENLLKGKTSLEELIRVLGSNLGRL